MLIRGLFLLSIIDFSIGLIVLPMYSAQIISGYVKNEIRLEHFVLIPIQRFVGYTLQGFRVSTISFIAVQMLYSVEKPFFYGSRINRIVSLRCLYFFWLLYGVEQ